MGNITTPGGMSGALGKYIAQLKQEIYKQIEEILEEVYPQLFAVIEERIRTIFNDAIRGFYSDYSPISYKRRNDMYALLETQRGDDHLKVWFEPGNMGGFRNGYVGEDGLYDQTFRRGWHGAFTRDWTLSGYRQGEGVVVKRGGGVPWSSSFVHGGLPTVVSDPSPLTEIKEKFEEYKHKQLRDDFLELWNKNKYKMKISLK